jgi:CSLREA domain-containing protein
MKSIYLALVASCLFFVGCKFPDAGEPGLFVVDTETDAVDSSPGDGVCATGRGECSLRAAIMESNADSSENTVMLPAGDYVLSISGEGGAEAGDLNITGPVRIYGDGALSTVIRKAPADLAWRIFHVEVGISGMYDLTIRDGNVLDLGGGLLIDEFSGLTLERVHIVDNDGGTSGGGGMYVSGIVELIDCFIADNFAQGRGGGIRVSPTGTLLMTRCTVHNNEGELGGGVLNDGEAGIENSTFSENVGRFGGGAIQNSTAGSTTIRNATIVHNHVTEIDASDRAAGILNSGGDEAVRMSNSLVAGNTVPPAVLMTPDCSGNEIRSQGYNLIGDTTGCLLTNTFGEVLNVDPLPTLGPLADNGGHTPTYALLAGSPALNNGSSAAPKSAAGACTSEDQRSVPRPQGLRCDIGAFELEQDLPIGIRPTRGEG